MKIIKFDLPINGTKVKNLEELRDNLTDEILTLARSSQLERWLRTRQLPEQAQAVATIVKENISDKGLFLVLCKVLDVEAHPDDVKAIFDVPPVPGRLIPGARYFELYKELVAAQEKALRKISTINFEIKLVKINGFIPYQSIYRGDFLEVSEVFLRNKMSIAIGEKIAELKISNCVLEIVAPLNGVVENILIKVGDKVKIQTAMVDVLEVIV